MSIDLNRIALAYGARTLLHEASASLPAGSVALCGRPLAACSPQERAAVVSFVATEKIRIADLTSEEVVALGRAPYTDWTGRLRAEDRALVARALELVGMAAFARKSLDRMSDGECQRVMIARALAQDTPVILLDEPTAFLDLPSRYELAMLLRRLAHEEGKCILFSTHDIDVALGFCDFAALIDSPSLCCLPAAEMARSGRIERLFAGSGIRFDAATGRVRLADE